MRYADDVLSYRLEWKVGRASWTRYQISKADGLAVVADWLRRNAQGVNASQTAPSADKAAAECLYVTRSSKGETRLPLLEKVVDRPPLANERQYQDGVPVAELGQLKSMFRRYGVFVPPYEKETVRRYVLEWQVSPNDDQQWMRYQIVSPEGLLAVNHWLKDNSETVNASQLASVMDVQPARNLYAVASDERQMIVYLLTSLPINTSTQKAGQGSRPNIPPAEILRLEGIFQNLGSAEQANVRP